MEKAGTMQWRVGADRVLDLSRHGILMGVLNVTPDSFSDGGIHLTIEAAVAHGLAMLAEGADVIDIGGESTRPGAGPVDAVTECDRVLPVVRALRERAPDALISVDTMKAEVAEAALKAGADIVNDVSGLTADDRMPEVAAASQCGLVVMHMQGTPRSMQEAPEYDDVVGEVAAYLAHRQDALVAAGVDPDRMLYDPGIGFGKTLGHNLRLIGAVDRLAPPGRPLLLGVSRKSFIAGVLGSPDMDARRAPTVALTSLARERGARAFRVHDVLANRHALRMTEAILGLEGEVG